MSFHLDFLSGKKGVIVEFELFERYGIIVMFIVLLSIAAVVSFLQLLDDWSKNEQGEYRNWKLSVLMNVLKVFTAGNSAVTTVAVNFVFDSHTDLDILTHLYCVFFYLNVAKGRFDDWYCLDSITGSIVFVYGTTAYNRFVLGYGPLDLKSTFFAAYILCVRLFLDEFAAIFKSWTVRNAAEVSPVFTTAPADSVSVNGGNHDSNIEENLNEGADSNNEAENEEPQLQLRRRNRTIPNSTV